MRQWMLKITAYADRLLDGLDDLDWPESIKQMQRNWIGRSTGAQVTFQVAGSDAKFDVFTTRPDTLFGATYTVMAPEHELVDQITTPAQQAAVAAYKAEIAHKSDLERTDLNKDKTGVWTGAYAINPVTGDKLPIWISDYVLVSYGTGAIMAVPAHDDRDFAFAKQFDLPITQVIDGGDVTDAAYTGDGVHINSGFLDGMTKQPAIDTMISWLEAHGVGEKKVNYKLRDWVFSRQRYWGEPIPIIHWEDGETTLVPEDELPLRLPEEADIQPSGTGESPLANVTDWVNVVDKNGRKGRRETNTMPQWAGSSWYYLRFVDPHNKEALADFDKLKQWTPVDLYIGGAEHAVLHLLYARFWNMFLYDIGVAPHPEPFQKLFNQGMILGDNHEKMSKSKGNVVNPDDVVAEYGADTLRLYEMFMGPLDAGIAWRTTGLAGARKFLDRVWSSFIDDNGKMRDHITTINDGKLDKVYNETVKKVTDDYADLHFNTAISQLMVFINEARKVDDLPYAYVEGFVKMLAPIAPHLMEEIWQRIGHNHSLTYEPWPTYDEAALATAQVELMVQVNGKLRGHVTLAVDAPKDTALDAAKALDNVQKFIAGKQIVKEIVVPNKIVNLVVK